MFDSDEKQGPFAQRNIGAQTTGNYPGVNTSSTYSPKSPKLSPTSQVEMSNVYHVSFSSSNFAHYSFCVD
jgi:hypothetical protein